MRPLRATIGRVEVPADPPTSVTKFFERVFGWTSREVTRDYRSCQPDVHPASGLALGVSASLDDVPVPLAVLDLHDASLETALEQIVEAGGSIDLPPKTVGSYGRFARFRDPAGNLFGLWAAEDL